MNTKEWSITLGENAWEHTTFLFIFLVLCIGVCVLAIKQCTGDIMRVVQVESVLLIEYQLFLFRLYMVTQIPLW